MNRERVVGIVLAVLYLTPMAWAVWAIISFHSIIFDRDLFRFLAGFCVPSVTAAILALRGRFVPSLCIAILAAVATLTVVMPRIEATYHIIEYHGPFSEPYIPFSEP